MPAYSFHQKNIEEFHKKHDFAIGVDFKTEEPVSEEAEADLLSDAASDMLQAAMKMEHYMRNSPHTQRIARAQIMIEELSEILEAMVTRDEVSFLDGLADLQFVLFGTAVAYGIDLEGPHLEVCRSNMSKAAGGSDQVRLRDKGPDYSPPNMKQSIKE